MLSIRTSIGNGYNFKKVFARGIKKQIIHQSLKKPEKNFKLPEVLVAYNPFEKRFCSVRYNCPVCEKRLWLNHDYGKREINCPFCKKNFILKAVIKQ